MLLRKATFVRALRRFYVVDSRLLEIELKVLSALVSIERVSVSEKPLFNKVDGSSLLWQPTAKFNNVHSSQDCSVDETVDIAFDLLRKFVAGTMLCFASSAYWGKP